MLLIFKYKTETNNMKQTNSTTFTSATQIFYAALLALLLIGSNVHAKNNAQPTGENQAETEFDWQENRSAKNRNEIATYISKVQNSNAKAFRAVAYFPYTIEEIKSTMHDVPAIKEWAYNCRYSVRPYKSKPKQTYMIFKGVWPVKDRDVITTYEETTAANGTVHIHIKDVKNGYPQQERYVRIPILDNHWYLTPQQDGGTKVEFITFVDIGGGVPKWLANMVAKDAPYQTVGGLREHIAVHLAAKEVHKAATK